MLLVAFPGIGCPDPSPIPVVPPHQGNAGWGTQILLRRSCLRKAELTSELRAEQMLPPLLWVILTWEGFSAEHCSANREPQSEVNEVVVNAEAGLKEIQKSASAGEQSQVTTSSREKKNQQSSWASDASSGIFSRRETELCPLPTAATTNCSPPCFPTAPH